jgi:hypothetical protein
MYQVAVWLTREQQWGQQASMYSFGHREERDEFVKSPFVWWYMDIEDGEYLFGNGVDASWDRPAGSGWKKGGAWTADKSSVVASEPVQEKPYDPEDRW